MKTILVLSSHPDFAEVVQTGLGDTDWRIVHRRTTEEAEPLLAHGLVSACLLDAEMMGVETVWCVEKIRRQNKKIPLIIYAGGAPAEWEEETLLRGANQILSKPVKPRLLVSLLERLLTASLGTAQRPVISVSAVNPTAARTVTESAAAEAGRLLNPAQTLDVLRDFSAILTHSLDAEAMLKQFLQFLREMLSINRAVIFLNRPCSPVTEAIAPSDGRRLRAVASIGINASLLEQFELSLDAGIGAQICRLGRILRRDRNEAQHDPDVQREFELLGAQIAVPIASRDEIIGTAVFDCRITGEPLVNAELELIFRLLEQVGLALRNIWLHDQLAGSHEMMSSVLRELNSACIVISRDLKVLHSNKAVRQLLGRKLERASGLEFSDLPTSLGSKIYRVLNSGAAHEPFNYETESTPRLLFRITILPFRHGHGSLPASALLIGEDLTESEQLRKFEAETAKLRLLNAMAMPLANEIRTALVPISMHHQLLNESYDDPEFRKSLESELGRGVKRIKRLADQISFLTPEAQGKSGSFAISKVIEEAFQEAKSQLGNRPAHLKLKPVSGAQTITGNRAALTHAFSEILLNALQANRQTPEVTVSLHPLAEDDTPTLSIEVQDSGKGFSPETARQATNPFFFGKEEVGRVGLGLTVSQKIIENHHGKLEIVPADSGLVRVILPLGE